jgi:hypothetical protein
MLLRALAALLLLPAARSELRAEEIAELNTTCRRVRMRTVEKYTQLFEASGELEPRRLFVATGGACCI